MFSKSFKTDEIILSLEGSEDKILINHNALIEDDQVMVEQVEQPADKQDEGMEDAEIDDNNNNEEEEDKEEKEAVGIWFTEQKFDPENDENVIDFRWSDKRG